MVKKHDSKADTDNHEITLAALRAKLNPTPANNQKPEGQVICYGVFRVVNSSATGGLWVIRKIVTDGDKLLSYEDSEPDVLDIQMGKIDRYVETATER